MFVGRRRQWGDADRHDDDEQDDGDLDDGYLDDAYLDDVGLGRRNSFNLRTHDAHNRRWAGTDNDNHRGQRHRFLTDYRHPNNGDPAWEGRKLTTNTEPLFTRRQVIGAAGALATVGFTSGLLGFRLAPVGAMARKADLSLASFTPNVGSEFVVTTGAGQERVTLVDATAAKARPKERKDLRGDAFSLVFAGAGAKAFNDGIFEVSHATMGTFPLFLVPVGKPVQAQRYEAVFDRRTPKG